MHKIIGFLLILLLSGSYTSFSQSIDATKVYLLTCSPGNEVESVYGHSAIRIVNPAVGFDYVYSWGVYDFSTENFVWKFAKGRLKYKIAVEYYEQFLQQYVSEQRSVTSQIINLSDTEKGTLIRLIENNMRPENRFYLYDFFYDNCATRIRDLIEKAVGDKIVYPDENSKSQPTFREKINEAQKPIPWLTFGTDMMIGTPGDAKTGFRERMFLPEDLRNNLSLTIVKTNSEIAPLLGKPVIVVPANASEKKNILVSSPLFIFSILLIFVVLASFLIKQKNFANHMDRLLFLTFSLLSVMMVFCNFITDHQAMKFNLNLIWLNPFLIVAFVALFSKKKPAAWFKVIFITSTGFLVSLVILPQSINIAFIPLILILILRSGLRSEFSFLKALYPEK